MQPRRTAAFPRTGPAGPGCQAATVADGRRKPETGELRWREGVSWMQGSPKNGRRKPATVRGRAGGRAEGREGWRCISPIFPRSIKYPSNKTHFARIL